jgi:hypothetical protein
MLEYYQHGEDRGPGIAALVLVKVLMDELVKKGILEVSDLSRILATSESILGKSDHSAIKEAYKVVSKMQ